MIETFGLGAVDPKPQALNPTEGLGGMQISKHRVPFSGVRNFLLCTGISV